MNPIEHFLLHNQERWEDLYSKDQKAPFELIEYVLRTGLISVTGVAMTAFALCDEAIHTILPKKDQ